MFDRASAYRHIGFSPRDPSTKRQINFQRTPHNRIRNSEFELGYTRAWIVKFISDLACLALSLVSFRLSKRTPGSVHLAPFLRHGAVSSACTRLWRRSERASPNGRTKRQEIESLASWPISTSAHSLTLGPKRRVSFIVHVKLALSVYKTASVGDPNCSCPVGSFFSPLRVPALRPSLPFHIRLFSSSTYPPLVSPVYCSSREDEALVRRPALARRVLCTRDAQVHAYIRLRSDQGASGQGPPRPRRRVRVGRRGPQAHHHPRTYVAQPLPS